MKIDFDLRSLLNPVRAAMRHPLSPLPLVCVFEATYRCNMRCPFCTSRHDENGGSEIDTQTACDLLARTAGLGTMFLYVTGGEPLLRSDIGRLLATAKSHRMTVMMGTNGYYLEERLPELKGNVDSIRVSLDLPDDRHDTLRRCGSAFSRAVGGIRKARSLDVPVSINMTVTADTLAEMEEMVRLAEHLDVSITLTPASSVARSAAQTPPAPELFPDPAEFAGRVRILAERHRAVAVTPGYLDVVARGGMGNAGVRCRAASLAASITPQGDLCLPCNACRSFTRKLHAGQTLEEAWFSAQAAGIRRLSFREGRCAACTNHCYLAPSLLLSAKTLPALLRSTRF